jgi:hypothetical protein
LKHSKLDSGDTDRHTAAWRSHKHILIYSKYEKQAKNEIFAATILAKTKGPGKECDDAEQCPHHSGTPVPFPSEQPVSKSVCIHILSYRRFPTIAQEGLLRTR